MGSRSGSLPSDPNEDFLTTSVKSLVFANPGYPGMDRNKLPSGTICPTRMDLFSDYLNLRHRKG